MRIRFLGLFWVLFLPVFAGAFDAAHLYEVDLPVANRSAGALNKAVRLGLEQVLMENTGRQEAAELVDEDVLGEEPLASWVDRYQYHTVPQQGLILHMEYHHQAVDELLANPDDSIVSDAVEPVLVELWVMGVGSLEDYTTLQQAIHHFPVVKEIGASELTGQTLHFTLSVSGGAASLQETLQSVSYLVRSEVDGEENAGLYYRIR